MYFGSIDPHFYFSAYIIPREDDFDMYYIPQVGNIEDNSIINMSPDNPNSKIGVSYGEDVSITLTNPMIEGFGTLIDIELSITESPIAVNTNIVSTLDIVTARDRAKELVAPLDEISLFELSNIVKIEVESKVNNILSSSVGVSQDSVVATIIYGILVIKKIFIGALPSELSDDVKDMLYLVYGRMLNVTPYVDASTVIFSDMVLFGRMIHEENINIMTIPFEILYRITEDWVKNKHAEQVSLLRTASLQVVINQTIEINMSSMEDTPKVYEALNKTQAFVYLTNIRFTNDDTLDFIDFPLENEYYRNYVKQGTDCVEVKGIPSSNGRVVIQYGYGSGCDKFIGLTSVDLDGHKRGVRRDDKIVDNEFVPVRTWNWITEEAVKIDNEVDTTHNITVTFTGV
jgi:hypothetical protein